MKMPTMSRAFLILASIGLLLFPLALLGCRANSTTTNNHIILGPVSGSVRIADTELGKGNNDATQAADKKVGDIAPKANVAAGPLSKAIEAGSNADAGSTTAPVPGL